MVAIISQVLSLRQMTVIGILFAFLLTFVFLRFPLPFLPRDQGREYAVNGALSKGKLRGVGLIFVLAFIVTTLLFFPLSLEYAIYCVLLFAMMLSGYLDDASEKPWSDYKKGIIDLVIAILTMCTFIYYNSTTISFFRWTFHVPVVLYFILGVILLWVAINVTNCSDGVDGLCASVSTVSLIGFALLFSQELSGYASSCLVFAAVLLAYLCFNASPSNMLMGDAGSRAIGFYLAVISMKTGHPFIFILMAAVLIADGGIGLVKVFLLRFLKIGILKHTTTPLHDHARKALGWSDTQVVFRFSVIQLLFVMVAALICL